MRARRLLPLPLLAFAPVLPAEVIAQAALRLFLLALLIVADVIPQSRSAFAGTVALRL